MDTLEAIKADIARNSMIRSIACMVVVFMAGTTFGLAMASIIGSCVKGAN